MSGLLDRCRILAAPGGVRLVKLGAIGGKVVEERDVAGEVLAALVDTLLADLPPGCGAAHAIRITQADGSAECFDLRLEPITAEQFYKGGPDE